MGYEQTAFLMELAQVPMFSSCTQHQLEQVARRASPQSVGPGEQIIRQGDDAEAFFVLMDGRATVSRDGRSVATLDSGEYFGELSLFDAGPRSATVEAQSECLLARIDRDEFVAALDELPGLRDALLRGMARRLHELDSKLAAAG